MALGGRSLQVFAPRDTILWRRSVIFVDIHLLIMIRLKSIYILLLCLCTLTAGSITTTASAQRAKTSSTAKKKKRTTTQRRVSARKRSVAQRTSSELIDAEVARLRRLDSIRQLHGEPRLVTGQDISAISDTSPIITRFRRGDTTLMMSSIESLYFGHQTKKGEDSFLAQIESEVDASIKASQYAKALQSAQRGLWRNPAHLGILKRACDLAHHEGHAKVDLYVWQLTELLYLISLTGDGTTHEDAYRVMSVADAYLFETLWLETPTAHILDRRNLTFQGRPLLALTIETEQEGKPLTRYYSIRQ